MLACVCVLFFVPYACNVVFLCLYAPAYAYLCNITTTYCCSQPSKSPEYASSVMVQLLAILIKLSDSGSSRDKLLTTDSLLDHLCSVLLYHCCDPDVAFSLCRLLRYVCMYVIYTVDVVIFEECYKLTECKIILEKELCL